MMSNKYTDEQISNAVKKMEGISDYSSWRNSGLSRTDYIKSKSFSKDDYLICLTEDIDSDQYIMEYVRRDLSSVFMSEYPELADYVIENTVYSSIKLHMVNMGYYTDISIIDKLCSDPNPEIRVWASYHCSIDSLKSMVDDSSSKVRRSVFNRLGPVEYLDLMLTDKDAQIRESGARFAPMNYDGFSKMCNELSKKVFPWIVSKIKREKLPMLLGNRNMKNSYAKKALSERMNQQQ